MEGRNTMGERNEMFGRLLRGAINSIAAYEGKTAAAVEDEVGEQIGLTGMTLQRYKAGHLPPDVRTVEVLAQAGVRRGFLGREWLQRFLGAARYPNPEALLAQLVEGSVEAPAPGALLGANLPTGTVTFLFTDIEGSTQLWERHPQAMSEALAWHDRVLRAAVEAAGGQVVKTTGDGLLAAFPTALAGVLAAVAAQRALQRGPAGSERSCWEAVGGLRVRMGLHTGSAEARAGDYYGASVNRAARLMAAGHGGQILLSQVSQELVCDELPPNTTLYDLGTHRLKDLYRPEHIFQLIVPDLPGDFPRLHTLEGRPTNLPAQPNPLIGRDADAALVVAWLRSDARLVTLTGVGGTGKTRLGLQVAADLLDDFRDGVFLVQLAPITDPELVAPAIAQVLQIKTEGDQDVTARLKSVLRDKQTLLVLDNFEQVIAVAPLVSELLAAAAGLKVLVTSRERLHLSGEHDFPVPPLALPPLARPGGGRAPAIQADALQALSQYAAVTLFIQRALAVRPDFQITVENAPTVAELCVRLDGLPLAIELAAARLRLFTPEGLLTRLTSRLAWLTGGPRDLPARQQTLRATIDWSYQLLSPQEQTLFARLAVFQGGCSLAAAEAICNPEGDFPLLDGLLSLVDKSLLRQATPPTDADAEPRFLMLETIREYATEKLLAAGEAPTLRTRHLNFFAQFAEEVELRLRSAAYAAWLPVCDLEQDNVRVALEWALQGGSLRVEAGLQLGGAWGVYWCQRWRYREGQSWLSDLLAQPEGSGVNRVRAKALWQLGTMSRILGDYATARTSLEASEVLSRALQDKHLLARTLHALAVLAYCEGDYTRQQALILESVSLYAEVGDRWDVTQALYGLAMAASALGDLEAARDHYLEALTIFRELDVAGGIGDTLANLAHLAMLTGNEQAAMDYSHESLAHARRTDDPPTIAFALGGLGDLASTQRESAQAIKWYSESLALVRGLDHPGWLANNVLRLGRAHFQQGDLAQAQTCYLEGLALFQTYNSQRDGLRLGLFSMAELAHAQAQMYRAARLLGAAATLPLPRPTELLPPWAQAYERIPASVRAALPEPEFTAAWEEGQAVSLAEAIAAALDPAAWTEPPRPHPRH
jgi:predicted ATPase/class 3 adenylate cyclase